MLKFKTLVGGRTLRKCSLDWKSKLLVESLFTNQEGMFDEPTGLTRFFAGVCSRLKL